MYVCTYANTSTFMYKYVDPNNAIAYHIKVLGEKRMSNVTKKCQLNVNFKCH